VALVLFEDQVLHFGISSFLKYLEHSLTFDVVILVGTKSSFVWGYRKLRDSIDNIVY